MNKRELLEEIYQKLFNTFGPQYWWPGDSPLEIVLGTVLTQNTNWKNVEKAIGNLKKSELLAFEKLIEISEEELAEHLRPSGYFNVKTKRLKQLLHFLKEHAEGDLQELAKLETQTLRAKLLSVRGVGKETADSILLYALGHPIFVVDTYTYRVFSRHFLIPEESHYDEMQELVMNHFDLSVERLNEFHALLVKVGKDYCRPTPQCEQCPLKGVNWNHPKSI